jgi:PAS domain-containing protein
MAQHGIEMILMRRLASHLTMPILLVDPEGDTIFFNRAAEAILGRQFDETGTIRRGEFSALFKPMNDDGTPMKREELPLFIATERQEAAYRSGRIEGLDGISRRIAGIGFPLVGQGDRMLGAVGIFWECDAPATSVASPAGPAPDLSAPGAGRPVEVILMRQLASYLATPIFLVGTDGKLIFYNEPAESLLGLRFDEADEMTLEEWAPALPATDEDGTSMDLDERPMIIALRKRTPAHRRFFLRGFDGVNREVEGTAFPLAGREGHQLGAVGIFWEAQGS